MKLSRSEKQLMHDYDLKKCSRNNSKNFANELSHLYWNFHSNAAFFCKEVNIDSKSNIKDMLDIVKFYEKHSLNTKKTNDSIICNIFPICINSLYSVNFFVNDYIIKLALLNYLGFSNDFYWEQIEKNLSKISYGSRDDYFCNTSYNFLDNMKQLYKKLENDSTQLRIVNKCILNVYYTYDKNKDNSYPKNTQKDTFCGILTQLQNYTDIFRSTSLLEEKLFNNMQKRINKEIINMKIKGNWIEKDKK